MTTTLAPFTPSEPEDFFPSSQLTQNQFQLPTKLVKLALITSTQLPSDELHTLNKEFNSYLLKHPEVIPLLYSSPLLANKAHNFLNRINQRLNRRKKRQQKHQLFSRYYSPLKLVKTPSNDKEVACQQPIPQCKDLSLNTP